MARNRHRHTGHAPRTPRGSESALAPHNSKMETTVIREQIEAQEQQRLTLDPKDSADHVLKIVAPGTGDEDDGVDVVGDLSTPPHPGSDGHDDDNDTQPSKKGKKRKGDQTFFELDYAMKDKKTSRKKAPVDNKMSDIRDSIKAAKSAPKTGHNRQKVPAIVTKKSSESDAPRRKKLAKKPLLPKVVAVPRNSSSKSVAHSDGSDEESSDDESYAPVDEAKDAQSIGEEDEDEEEEDDDEEDEEEEEEEEERAPPRRSKFVDDEAGRPLKQRRLFRGEEEEEEEEERPTPKRKPAPKAKKTKSSKREQDASSEEEEEDEEEEEEEEDSVEPVKRTKTVTWKQGAHPPTNPRHINAAASSVMHAINPKTTKAKGKSKGKAAPRGDVSLCDVARYVTLSKKLTTNPLFHFQRWTSGPLSTNEILSHGIIAEHLPNITKRVRTDVIKFMDEALLRDLGSWTPLSKQNRGRISKLHQHLIHFCDCFGLKEKQALAGLCESIELTMEQFGENELRDAGLLCDVYVKYTNQFVKVAISQLAEKLRAKGQKLIKHTIAAMEAFADAL